jgi:hypothetical protein
LSLSDILNVGIVLIAIYVSLSCVCSWVNEQIASMLRLRGRCLFDGVLNLLLGNKSLVDAVFAHPLITSVSRDFNGKPRVTASGAALPAVSSTSANIFLWLWATVQKALPSRTYRPSYLEARSFSIAFWHSVQAITQQSNDLKSNVEQFAMVNNLLDAVASLPEPEKNLARVLNSFLIQSKGDYDKLLEVTDTWFNAQMDRVSGWYRRQTQWIIMSIALVIVTCLGIDSLDVIKTLSTDPSALQQAVIQIAKDLPTSTLSPLQFHSKSIIPASTLASSTSTPVPTPNPESVVLVQKFAETLQKGAQGADQALWNSLIDIPCLTAAATCKSPVKSLSDLGINRFRLWRNHFFGLAITAVALSLGGPFWFDTLCMFVNVRAAGIAPTTNSSKSSTGK